MLSNKRYRYLPPQNELHGKKPWILFQICCLMSVNVWCIYITEFTTLFHWKQSLQTLFLFLDKIPQDPFQHTISHIKLRKSWKNLSLPVKYGERQSFAKSNKLGHFLTLNLNSFSETFEQWQSCNLKWCGPKYRCTCILFQRTSLYYILFKHHISLRMQFPI